MDKLKSFIEQNRSQFDTEEPMLNHFERFRQKLENEEKEQLNGRDRSPFSYSLIMLKIAAIVVLTITVGAVVVSSIVGDNMEPNVLTAKTINNTMRFVEQTKQKIFPQEAEYLETQNYYMYQVDNRLDKIKEHDGIDKEQKRELLKELTEMDELFIQLQKQLKTDPENPDLIDAMIKHYQIKIDAMNQIITNLNSIKHLNAEKNEKIDL